MKMILFDYLVSYLLFKTQTRAFLPLPLPSDNIFPYPSGKIRRGGVIPYSRKKHRGGENK